MVIFHFLTVKLSGYYIVGRPSTRWEWECFYRDGDGVIRSLVRNIEYEEHKYVTDNEQINQIYEWCKDIMGEVE